MWDELKFEGGGGSGNGCGCGCGCLAVLESGFETAKENMAGPLDRQVWSLRLML